MSDVTETHDTWLPDQWYPLIESQRLRRKPLGLQRLGEHLVLWRDADGRAVALRDRCPHRGVALSLGAPAMAFDPTPEISTPAQAFRFGLDAYRVGDLVTAMDAFSYAAERGYIRAKWMLGR